MKDRGPLTHFLDTRCRIIEDFVENCSHQNFCQISLTFQISGIYQLPPSLEIQRNYPPSVNFGQYIRCIGNKELKVFYAFQAVVYSVLFFGHSMVPYISSVVYPVLFFEPSMVSPSSTERNHPQNRLKSCNYFNISTCNLPVHA